MLWSYIIELIKKGYVILIEEHPANKDVIVVKINKDNVSKVGAMQMVHWNDASAIRLMEKIKEPLDLYLKTMKG